MNLDLYNKISILGPSAKYDTCGPKDLGETTKYPGVYHAKVAGNHVCRLFKVLQTNTCKNNCKYCAFRKDRDTTRTVLTPDEMAASFEEVYSHRLVDGLFLSSGIAGTSDFTMTKMLDTLHIVRDKYKYKGYVHLKIMPGSSNSVICEAVKLANRVSINIESPTDEDLLFLSPEKSLKTDFFTTLNRVKSEITKLRISGAKRLPSITTQFIVGAGEEKDKDLIKMTDHLYKNYDLNRVFYSSFRPIEGTPLADKPAETVTRGHRLYQADWLMRFYKFKPVDIFTNDEGYLDQDVDPKMMWVKAHPELFPINLNLASYWDLLKVPGIGPESAKKIQELRRNRPIQYLSELTGFRFQFNKILPYVCV